IIAGGPGAWQLALKPKIARALGIDCIVEGEGEKIISEIVRKAIDGEPLPFHFLVEESNVPSADEIPPIRKPSNNGIIEISRGSLREGDTSVRHIPIEKIAIELKVNMNSGLKEVLLQSKDVPLYGSTTLEPNPEAFKKVHSLVINKGNEISWTQGELTSIYLAEKKYHLISWLREKIETHQEMWGAQVPVITGSYKLANFVMPERIQPFPPSKWPHIVEECFSILNESKMVPIATFILGLPEETPDDLIRTLELLDKLRKYRSTLIPFLFISPDKIRGENWYSRIDMSDLHKEILLKMFYHSLYWGEKLVKGYLNYPMFAPLRAVLRGITSYVKVKAILKVRKFMLKGEV
ncbi:MAG: radical SAM protein, partial [Candidatus Korarchaeota archaeon]